MAKLTIALTYTRVSTDEQARGGVSLAMQDVATLRYVTDRRWWLGKRFTDTLSGRRDDRPGYQALLSEIRRLVHAGEKVVVVVWRLDRLGRRLVERARSWEELEDLGVKLHSVTEGGEAAELTAHMLAVVAHMEVKASSQRIRAAHKQIQSDGWWSAGLVPYGYRWRPRTLEEQARGAPRSVLDVEPIQAEHVVEAFRQLAQGASAGSVHRWIANLPDEDRGGRAMHRRSVFLMFKAPVYAGRFEDGREGNWPKLVDEETFQAAQQALTSRRAPLADRAASGRYLLTGFLKCSNCGRPMLGMTAPASKARAYAQSRYRCRASNYGEKCRASVSVESVDAQVLDQVAALIDRIRDPRQRKGLEQEWTRRRTKALAPDQDRLRKKLEHEVTDAKMGLVKLDVLLAKDRITDERHEEAYRQLLGELQAAQERLEALETPAEPAAPLPQMDQLLTPASAWRAALDGSDVEAQRRVLSLFVTSILAERVRWGVYQTKVTWTPLGDWLMMPVPVTLEDVG